MDNDVGPNGDLTYSITKGNTNLDFMVDSHGRIVVSKLPSKSVYSLEISVSDLCYQIYRQCQIRHRHFQILYKIV
jgi:hypothetical protein